MLAIQDSRVSKKEQAWFATCVCGYQNKYSSKDKALKMLERGSCRHCKKHYLNVGDNVGIHQREDKKWCSNCSGCGAEQAYTRKDHAKQSTVADWQCKKCVARSKGFSKNMPVGDTARLYNKFRKSANMRKIKWSINIKDFENCYDGFCALTGWEISMSYQKTTASLDRIDSNKPYEVGNIQWVHSMVNMSKNKYPQDEFIKMCKAVADKEKW